MPIVFSAVACEKNIKANFASCDGNFMEIAETVVSKLPPCNNKMTYSHGVYLLHYIAEDGYLYFCITDKLCQRSRAFLFLNEIQRRYIRRKSSDDFTTVLAGEMYRYSEDYNTITIRKGELDELNKIGVGCSESLLGEKILYINNPDIISYSTVSHVRAIPERISVSLLSQTEEEISNTNVRPEALSISVINPTDTKIIHEETITKETAQPIEVNEKCLSVTPKEEILLTSSTSNKLDDEENTSMVTPKLFIVIIGMIMLVVVLAIYAFGPYSCAIVTSIGIYSLLRSYVDSKGKSE